MPKQLHPLLPSSYTRPIHRRIALVLSLVLCLLPANTASASASNLGLDTVLLSSITHNLSDSADFRVIGKASPAASAAEASFSESTLRGALLAGALVLMISLVLHALRQRRRMSR